MNRRTRRIIQVLKELDAGKPLSQCTEEYNLTKTELTRINLAREKKVKAFS